MVTMKSVRRAVVSSVVACGVIAIAASVSLSAQQSSSRTLGLDPYKPSDAKLLRDIGPTVATQMSMEELSKLDPYKPSEAALLRQLGGGVPACCFGAFWPIAPIAAGQIYTPPSTTLPLSSIAQAPAIDPQIIFVCKGSECTKEDRATHRFSPLPLPAAREPIAAQQD
jgi:hypothetical protein